MGRVIMLTGERGVGKSTVCRRGVTLAQGRGLRCGGIITVAQRGDRYVLDVHSGRRRRLTDSAGSGQAGRGNTVVTQGRFHFDPRVLSWGSAILSRATPCDLLVVDEVGPLEIERGKGWVRAFDVLRAGGYALALVVVRPELLAQARDRLSGRAVEVLTVTRQNRDRLPVTLVDLAKRELQSAAAPEASSPS